MALLMGLIKPKTNSRNTAVSVATVAKAVVKTVSGLAFSSLAKRNSVVSMPNVSSTSMSAV